MASGRGGAKRYRRVRMVQGAPEPLPRGPLRASLILGAAAAGVVVLVILRAINAPEIEIVLPDGGPAPTPGSLFRRSPGARPPVTSPESLVPTVPTPAWPDAGVAPLGAVPVEAQPIDRPLGVPVGETTPPPAPSAASYDPAVVDRILANKAGDVRACHSFHFRGTPFEATAAASVSVEVEIDEAGRVAEARVTSSTLPGPAFSECVAASVRQANFPPLLPGQTLKVKYLYQLQHQLARP